LPKYIGSFDETLSHDSIPDGSSCRPFYSENRMIDNFAGTPRPVRQGTGRTISGYKTGHA